VLNFTLLALVCIHVAAALRHHFVDRDAVLNPNAAAILEPPRFAEVHLERGST
jgi:hypothetical protein